MAKWLDRLIVTFTMALVVAVLATAMHVAAVQAVSAEAQEGIELPIMMYHHVLKDSARLGTYTVSPDELRADFEYFRAQGYEPILMQDLINYVRVQTPLPAKPVLITFDDGYESFHEYVYPLLQEFDYKAVFSVVGRYADQYTKTEDHHVNYSHCNWEQLREMQQSGLVEIQNHSYNLHTNDQGRKGLKRKQGENLVMYREMLIEDLGRLQLECEENLGVMPTTVTYPFGHYGPDTQPIIMEMGFQAALICQERMNYITGDPEQLYHLNRFNRVHGKSAQTIIEQAKGRVA